MLTVIPHLSLLTIDTQLHLPSGRVTLVQISFSHQKSYSLAKSLPLPRNPHNYSRPDWWIPTSLSLITQETSKTPLQFLLLVKAIKTNTPSMVISWRGSQPPTLLINCVYGVEQLHCAWHLASFNRGRCPRIQHEAYYMYSKYLDSVVVMITRGAGR